MGIYDFTFTEEKAKNPNFNNKSKVDNKIFLSNKTHQNTQN